MPRFLKICNFAGCPVRTVNVGGFCDTHQNEPKRRQEARVEAEPWRKWYHWSAWRRLKERFRAEKPEVAGICQGTNPLDGLPCRKPAQHTDHVVPHKGSWELFIDMSNLQGLCHECHSRKTAEEDGGFGNQKVVTEEDDE